MEKKRIFIGNKTYTVEIADTEELQKKGLQGRDYLAPDEGMLFVYPKEQPEVKYWMKDTKIPLDQIAINDDDEVVLVYKAQPEDETLVPFMNTKYILEVNQDSGIVEGDEFEIDNSDDLDKYVMKVLAPDGSTQFFLQGGERIFSRIHTRTLIKKAKKAQKYKNNEAEFTKKCKALGKYMFKCIHKQDTQQPEYVQVPDNKNSNDKNS